MRDLDDRTKDTEKIHIRDREIYYELEGTALDFMELYSKLETS